MTSLSGYQNPLFKQITFSPLIFKKSTLYLPLISEKK